MPEVVLDEPEALRQLHREFLRAGAEVMVALTYYALNYKDPVQVFVISSLNAVVAGVTQGFGGRVGDGFAAFGAIALSAAGGDSCAAGLLIKLADGTCNIHPSAFGANVLAQAVQAAL